MIQLANSLLNSTPTIDAENVGVNHNIKTDGPIIDVKYKSVSNSESKIKNIADKIKNSFNSSNAKQNIEKTMDAVKKMGTGKNLGISLGIGAGIGALEYAGYKGYKAFKNRQQDNQKTASEYIDEQFEKYFY